MPSAPTNGSSDSDGVRVVERGGAARRSRLVYQGLAVFGFLVAGCVGYALTPRSTPPRGTDRPVAPPVSATDREAMKALAEPDDVAAQDAGAQPATGQVAAAAPSRRSLTPRRLAAPREEKPGASDLTPEQQQLAEKLKAEGRTEMKAGEYIRALHDAGIYEGIGAFNPPGTSPPLEGLAVPEDYELPEGFVRHYQATDDGQPIEPILMFDPQYEFFDANGNRIQLPDNLVVPPEYVPGGFPIRAIEIPAERQPGDVSR